VNSREPSPSKEKISRREFLFTLLAGTLIGLPLMWFIGSRRRREQPTETFISCTPDYTHDMTTSIVAGLKELNVRPEEIRGKRILLKPNLVETLTGADHITTHPAVIMAAAEAFLRMGAADVIVAEGPGHCRDTFRVLEESGLAQALHEASIPFVDLNQDDCLRTANAGSKTRLRHFMLPATLHQVDWLVSMPKLKTHHWAGVSLAMKNLFGVMPGIYYGWPKNVLHHLGIEGCVYDINATLRPHFAIVDGIVGMEGDGPIMGTPKKTGVIVMGRNLPAVDATCARIMGVNPDRVRYLAAASDRLGTIGEEKIAQRGAKITSVQRPFQLIDRIPAHKGLRL
jgi:uncharacterized protein (DUF362 family)